jgi:hypothetical protein
MDVDFSSLFDELKKVTIYGIIAKDDKSGEALKFVRALFDNGCPPDVFMNAVMSLQESKEDKE